MTTLEPYSMPTAGPPGPALGEGTVEELRRSLLGDVITPADPEYGSARRVWNGSIDRRPALIVRPMTPADVVEAVRFARSERLLVAVRGGAHSVAGHSTCDGGLVIDLGAMRDARIDPDARTARVEGGAHWADLDGAAQAFGLATTGGLISTTGVAGLTLGGGVGWLMRKHGLACDNLVSADLVTADGTMVTASERENPDLLWALRGGGGNFGVVTSLTFRLHPVGVVLGGVIVHPLEDAAAVLREYRDLAAGAPDELTTVLVLATVPPSPEFPPEAHGRRVLMVGLCYAGPLDEGGRAIAPLRALGSPLLEHVGPMPYAVRQTLQDASAPAGLGNYWRSDFLAGLPDGLIDLLVECAGAATSPLGMVHLYHLGGAVARVGEDDTAHSHRAAEFLVSVVGAWADPAADPGPHVEWVRRHSSGIRRYGAGAYVNFLGEEEARDRGRSGYGPKKYARLAAVKARFDPTNMFRLNHNVEPARDASEWRP